MALAGRCGWAEMSGWGSHGTLTWGMELCRAPGCHLAPATQFYSGTNSQGQCRPMGGGSSFLRTPHNSRSRLKPQGPREVVGREAVGGGGR